MSDKHIGSRFGALVVIGASDQRSGGKPMLSCRCDCGVKKPIRTSHLVSGKVRSCGCLTAAMIGDAKRDHGKSKTRIYRIWRDMINRCHYDRHPDRRYYGGRGVAVCDEWRSSFKAFYRDMGDPPTGIHSIDRIDNDAGYEKSNCRWATPKEQAANRRKPNARA